MKKATLVSTALLLASTTNSAWAETVYASAPWIVESGYNLDGEAVCSIAVLSPLGYGVTLERGRSQTTVQVFDVGKNYTPDEKVMWVTVGEDIFMWDGFRSGEMALTTQQNSDDRIVELTEVIGTTPKIGFGTFQNPTIEFPSPGDQRAIDAFQECVDGL